MIKLRALEKCDLSQMKVWRNDIIDMCREYRLINDEHQMRWWEEYSNQAFERYPKHLMFGIIDDEICNEFQIQTPDMTYKTRKSPKLLGVCGWTNIDWLNRRAELSIYIGTEHQNNGLGRKALHALHDIAFNQLGFKAIWLEVHDWNPNARKLYESEGYKLIGQFRDARFRDGKYHPTWIYDLTEDDWRANHS